MSNYSYTKLSSGLIHSSIWCEPLPTKVTWITMLALPDQYGRVMVAIPGLAKAAGVSIEDVEKALECFLAPDAYSRTKTNDGRRIEVIDKGWRLLNYEDQRDEKDEEHQRKRNAKNVAAHRERKKTSVTECKRDVSGVSGDVSVCNPIAEAKSKEQKQKALLAAAAAAADVPSVSYVPKEQSNGTESQPCSSAQEESERFSKHFGTTEAEPEDVYVPTARMQNLAAALGKQLGVEQDLDFNLPTP